MRTILHLATSADGFIARENGDSDWVSRVDEKLFESRSKEAGCLVVGKRTFDQYKGSIYPVSGALNIVLTSEPYTQPLDSSIVFASSPEEAVDLAEKNGNSQMVVAGGARTARSFLDAGLIDEIFLSVHPIILHKGIKPFEDVMHDGRYKFVEEKQLEEDIKELHYVML